MKLARLVVSIVFVFAALVLAQEQGTQGGTGTLIQARGNISQTSENAGEHDNADAAQSGIGLIGNRDNGPAVSSPHVKHAPNGDRESNYPPYYHPSK